MHINFEDEKRLTPLLWCHHSTSEPGNPLLVLTIETCEEWISDPNRQIQRFHVPNRPIGASVRGFTRGDSVVMKRRLTGLKDVEIRFDLQSQLNICQRMLYFQRLVYSLISYTGYLPLIW